MWIGVVKLLKQSRFEMHRSFLDTKISSDFWDFWDALISGFGTSWNDSETN